MQLGFRNVPHTITIFVKHLQFSRVGGPCLLLAGSTLLLSFAGCGGGNSYNVTPTPGPTVFATSVAASCDSTTYLPNYYAQVDPSNTTATPVYNFWRQFPLKIYIPDTTDAAVRTATVAGFDQWVTATNKGVSYQLVMDPTTADIVVSYTPATTSSSAFGTTTLTYDAAQHFITSAQIQLLSYTQDQVSSANLVNQTNAAHEFGHALGITPHSPYIGDLMYPALQRAVEVVSTRDLNTLKTVYCNNFPVSTAAAVKSTGATKTIVIHD